ALVLAGDALACTCAAVPARQRLDSADAAFIGRVLETRAAPARDGERELVYVFAVDSVVKGELDDRVEVVSTLGGAACGFELRRDEATGILLRRDTVRGVWIGGLCGQIAVGELIAAAEETDEPIVNWGGIVVGTAILALGVLLLVRRLRARRATARG
ncbi:MAG TPA: hypothetical protein VNP93_08975, partial [Gaiellaceae bacterium]|nr:hypothetical protein [Gaiellaceae bacterium]